MNKKRKVVLFTSGGALVLILGFFLFQFIVNSQFSSRIPEISDSQSLSPAVAEQISEAFNTAHRKPDSENLGMLGMVYHSSANYSEAAKCYGLAIERSKTDWIWNYYNGFLSMEMVDSETAIDNFKSVIQKNPDIEFAWYYLGKEYRNIGKNELAEEAFNRIASQTNGAVQTNETTRQDHFPLNTYVMFELARIYFDTGRIELAEQTLKDLIQKYYLFGPAYKLLGSLYNLNGDIELGEKYTVRSNDLVIYSPPVDTLIDKLTLLSRSELFLLKKIDEAERGIYSDWTLRLVNQGLNYMPENKYLISKAIKVFLWKNLNQQAIALTSKHLEYFQDSFNELDKTGNLFFLKMLYPQAITYCQKALEIEPENVQIQENLAKCYQAVDDKQKSIEVLNNLLGKNQNNPDVIADVTYLLLHFGEKEKAIVHLEKLKKMAPSNPKTLKILGEMAQASGDFQKAVLMYEASFKGNPEDLTTIRNLGDILQDNKMWDKYMKHCREALKYHPNDPELLGRLAEFLINCPVPELANIEEGKEYAERTFTHFDCPVDVMVSAGSHLAFAYINLGDKQRAITTISQTINIGRRQNISAPKQKKLENLYEAIQKMDN